MKIPNSVKNYGKKQITDISKLTQEDVLNDKKIHIYYVNKIKMAMLRLFEAEEDEDYQKIRSNNESIECWFNKSGVPSKYKYELLENIKWQNDDCAITLEKLGWKILRGKENEQIRKK